MTYFQTDTNSTKKIAYYLWRYPVLSETFIQREITGLQEAGLPITVIADGAGDLEVLDEQVHALADDTYYLFPLDKKRLLCCLANFGFKQPGTLIRCLRYICTLTRNRLKKMC